MATFKRTRRPDAIGQGYTLDQHIADTSANPHSQYALKSELEEIQSGITISTDVNNQKTTEVPACSVTYMINQTAQSAVTYASTAVDTVNAHIAAKDPTVAGKDYTGSDIPHKDTDGKNLYAARQHTHTADDGTVTGFAATIHQHAQYLEADDLTGYVKKDDLLAVGIYDKTKNLTDGVTADINCNDYVTQGSYYIYPATTQKILNGPVGVSSGFMTVARTTNSSETSISLLQIFYTDDNIWKRSATGTHVSGQDTTYTFGSWKIATATNPIGSVMFMTGPVIPGGYLEANGAQLSKTAYPLLWEYAKTTDYLPTTATDDEKAAGKGKYWDIDDANFRIPDYGGEFMRMWTASQTTDSGRVLGSLQSGGLPNITGALYKVMAGGGRSATGAFSISNVGNDHQAPTAGDYWAKNETASFDASCSSSLYGAATEVRPQNVSVHVLIKAYNGSIIPADTEVSTLRAIIQDELSKYGTASTSAKGFIQLATADEVQTGTDANKAVTPATLKNVYHQPVFITPATTLTCTSIIDIADSTASYVDASTGLTLTESQLAGASVTPMLKCLNASNSLGYPVNAIISNPTCSWKTAQDDEYMGQPQVVLYNDASGNTRYRLYWPLLWYAKPYSNTKSNNLCVGAKMYPMVLTDDDTDPTIATVTAEMAYWTLQLKLTY